MGTASVGTGNGEGSKNTRFQPDWKGGPGRPRATVGRELPTPLDDMRHVYRYPASKDRTPGQKRCRQFFEDDFKGFVTLYMKLEEADQAEVAAAPAPDSSVLTPGEQELRVEELIKRLLIELADEAVR